MSFLDRIFKRSSATGRAQATTPSLPTPVLLGCWQLVRSADDPSEPAEADFRADGQLFYSVLSGDRWQVMKLLYEVDGEVLVTDQPSSPRKERTRFAFGGDGMLMLEFVGVRWTAKLVQTGTESGAGTMKSEQLPNQALQADDHLGRSAFSVARR